MGTRAPAPHIWRRQCKICAVIHTTQFDFALGLAVCIDFRSFFQGGIVVSEWGGVSWLVMCKMYYLLGVLYCLEDALPAADSVLFIWILGACLQTDVKAGPAGESHPSGPRAHSTPKPWLRHWQGGHPPPWKSRGISHWSVKSQRNEEKSLSFACYMLYRSCDNNNKHNLSAVK